MVLTAGVMMVVAVNIKFHIIGMVCALCSTVIFVMQNIFSKRIFAHQRSTGLPKAEIDKINLIFYSSTFSFILMLPLWLLHDGRIWIKGIIMLDFRLSTLFILNAFSHFMQALLAFSMLSLVSPVTYSIASLFKRIFVITASIVYFQDDVIFTQGLGLFITFTGLYLYQKAEGDVERAEKSAFKDDKPLLGVTFGR